MASIFTGLAFMHGHIVNRELVLRLGRDDTVIDRGTGARQVAPERPAEDRKASKQAPVRPACVTC